MKKFLFFILLTVAGCAAVNAANDVRASGECGNNMVWSISNDSVLTISGEGEMYDFRHPEMEENGLAPWIGDSALVKELVIEEGVVKVGKNAFSMMKLSKVTLPASLEELEDNSFRKSGVESIEIGENVKIVGWNAFEYCNSLKSVVVKSAKTEIGSMAFSCCAALENVTLPADIEGITPDVFQSTKWYNGIKGVVYIGTSLCGYNGTMPAGYELNVKEGTKLICGHAMEHQDNLVKVVIPKSVEKIGYAAFFSCDNLKTCDIPATTDVEDAAFDGTAFISDLNRQSGMVYLGATCKGYIGNLPEGVKSLTVREGTKKLEWNAFNGKHELESVKLPNSVEEIGAAAFNGCTGLTEMVMPQNLITINIDAFRECTGLMSVTLNSKLNYIGAGAFAGCSALTTVTIPAEFAPEQVHAGAFSDTPWLNAQSNDIYMGRFFFGFKKMVEEPTDYVVKDGTRKINFFAFSGHNGLKSVKLPDTVESIGEQTFAGCENLEWIELSKGTKMYNTDMFAHCPKLRALVIPEGAETFHGHGLIDCDSLKKIEMPSTLKQMMFMLRQPLMVDSMVLHFDERIEWFCPMSCPMEMMPNLKYYEGPALGLTTTADFGRDEGGQMMTNRNMAPDGGYGPAETYSKQLKEVIVTCGLLDTAEMRFVNKSKATIEFMDMEDCSNTELREKMFEGYGALKVVKLPKGLVEIGDQCFKDCNNIDTIRIMSNMPPTVAANAFDGVKDGIVLEVPAGAEENYKSTAEWERFLPEGVVTKTEESYGTEFTVWGSEGVLHIENMPEEGYEVYDLTGRCMYRGSDETVNVGRGVFIIRAGGRCMKTAL